MRVTTLNTGRTVRAAQPALLEGDGGAGALDLLLGLRGRLLGDLLQDALRGTVDQVLGLLEAQAGQRSHLLDDLDLLVTGSLEDDVELVLLLGGRGLTGTGTRCGNRGDRGRGGDVEGLLELLDELRELEQRHLLERVEQVVARQLRHDASYFLSLLAADRPR